jgi:hypothetical protein
VLSNGSKTNLTSFQDTWPVNVTVNVMLEIRENQLNQRHPRAKNGLAQRGNRVANW